MKINHIPQLVDWVDLANYRDSMKLNRLLAKPIDHLAIGSVPV